VILGLVDSKLDRIQFWAVGRQDHRNDLLKSLERLEH
jgi:hypothetical protein